MDNRTFVMIENITIILFTIVMAITPYAHAQIAIMSGICIILIASLRMLDLYYTPGQKTSKRKPIIEEWDVDDNLDFDAIETSLLYDVKAINGKYIPPEKFSKTENKEVDFAFVKSVTSKIIDSLAKKSITVKFKDYNATQQLLTINFIGGDTVNENGTITYFDVQRCERALPNVQNALGTNNVRFVPFTGIDGVVAFTVGIANGNMLSLGNLYDEFKNDNLTFIVGKDLNGETVYNDLTSNPHSLIVGATNSGKSSFIRQMIAQLITTKLPNELELWASDIKLTELSVLKNLPHTKQFADTLENTVQMLNRLMDIMNSRNQILQKAGSPDVLHYNKKHEKLPLILVIIEEFMLLTTNDDNENIIRLLQGLLSASRSAGIYFILASQIANANILPTSIRGNLGGKFIFKISNKSENTVLGTKNAHLLNGNGDALFLKGENEIRVQTPFLSPEELLSFVEYVRM